MSRSDPPPPTFAEKHREICEAAMRLQDALRRAFAEILPDDVGARSVGRRLGVDKMLGWQALRIATSPDPAVVVAALPGERGMSTLLESLGREGVSHDVLKEVISASSTLRAVFERHGVSAREIVAIATGGLDSESQRRHFAKMQKLHFESSVAMRGEVLNAHLSIWFATPSTTEPSKITLVNASMLDGFRTIRPLGPRLVHRGVAVDRSAEAGEWERLDRMGRNPVPSLVPEASTPDLAPGTLQARSTPNATMVLADPDASADGTLTLSFADLIDSIGPMHATPGHRTGELSVQVAVPVRHLYLDVLFDETLPPVEPSAALYFTPTHGVEYGEHAELRRFTGKFEARFARSQKLPAAAKVDPEKHAALLEHAAGLIDRPLEAFRCFRMHIAYPPIATRAVVRWLLPTA